MKLRLALIGLVVAVGLALVWKKPTPAPILVTPSERITQIEPPRQPEFISEQSLHTDPPVEMSTPVSSPIETNATALLAAIVAALDSADAETRDNLFTNLLPALVAVDPVAAGQFAATNHLGDSRELVLDKVARLLAAQNLTNALGWVSGLQFDGEREAALTDVCRQLAETQPAQAVALRAGFLTQAQAYEPLEDLTQTWADKDVAASLAWVNSLPADERRDLLLGRVAYAYAQTSPADAARLVVEKMMPGEAQIEAAVSVLHQWGKQDRAAATEWAERFPEGDLRTRALQELAVTAQSNP